MATYWHHHPRNFANECDIWRADTTEQAEALDAHGFARLTYKEARAHVAWINAENDAFGNGRAFGRIDWDDLTHSDNYSARHFLDNIKRADDEKRLLDEQYDAVIAAIEHEEADLSDDY